MAPIDGFNLWVGASRTDRPSLQNGVLQDREDHHEGNVGATFTFGPVKIGAAKAVEFTGAETAGTVSYYNNTMYGVSFNVNDDLSLSANRFESQKKIAARFSPVMEVTSFQAAYSMGGASFKLAKTDSDNTAYSNATSAQKDAWIMAMTLAF